MTLAPGLIAWHGALLAVAASCLVMGALRLNPRMFLRHFPAAVRSTQPALSPGEKIVGRGIAAVLITLLVAVPIWSAGAGAGAHAYGRVDVFLHAFLVAMAFNLTDWLILDELWLGLGRPPWVLPPGVTPADVPFDHWQHARGFLTGTVLSAVIGAIAALVV